MSDLRYFDDVGQHGHRLLRAQNATSSGGAHMHVWAVESELRVSPDAKIPAKSLLISSYDGAHDHTMGEDGLRTAADGEHRHGVRIRGIQLGTEKDGPHDHEALIASTGSAGVHQHTLKIGGVSLVSLSTGEMLRMLEAEMSTDEDSETEDFELRQTRTPGEMLKSLLERTGRPVYGVESTGLPGRMLNSLDKLVLETDRH